MESGVVTVCVIIAVLGVISAALGFAAEATRVKGSRTYRFYDPRPSSSPALGLGMAAAVLAVAVRITIGVYAGICTFCQKGPLFTVSWIASVIAVILLMVAAGLNNRHGCEVDDNGKKIRCSELDGAFSTGAVFSLASAFLGIAAILTLNSSRQADTTAGNIPMGMHPPVAAANYNIDPEKRPVPQQNY